MKRLRWIALLAIPIAFAFSGCAGRGHSSALPDLALSNARNNSGSDYQIVYAFDSSQSDFPSGDLLDQKGTFYGVTSSGGPSNYGTVFSVTPKGKERTIYSFHGAADGAFPLSGLVSINGVFYGTTSVGGKYKVGTLYSVTPAGAERIIYNFGAKTDGKNPMGGLVAVNGILYGTTSGGGEKGSGTVFAMTTAGKETILHAFDGYADDGGEPFASLTVGKGVFYGTTMRGGACYGQGTAFSVTTSGDFKLLHSFGCNYDDGVAPVSSLTLVKNILYGTTNNAVGPSQCNGGSVFSMSLSGKEKVIHFFCSQSGGEHPMASVTMVKGTLYGTTNDGGANDYGTLFSVDARGNEHLLHSFSSGQDGQNPHSGLLHFKNALYGTTEGGGSGSAGTIYKLLL